jgi:cytochrome c556
MGLATRRATIGLVAIVGVLAPASVGVTQDLDQFRTQFMRGMGAHMAALAAFLPDVVDHAAGHAAGLAALAALVPDIFPEGSGGEGTRAKPEIWQNWADFTAKAQGLQTAAAALVQASAGGDMAAIEAAVDKVAGACSACHDVYRAEAQ